MSLILDALRKSERTRQQNLSGRVSAAGAPPARTRIPVPWATLIGLLLIANVVTLGLIFWHSRANHPTSVSLAAASSPALATEPAPAPIYRPAVRSLAAEVAAAGVTSGPAPTASTSSMPSSAAATKLPVSTPVTAPTAIPASANPSATENMDLNGSTPPPLDTLPLAFQQSLPPLHLDVHSYSVNPAERFVIINMQRYQKGDTLKEGPKVIAIVSNGVILEYQGQQFLLPRP